MTDLARRLFVGILLVFVAAGCASGTQRSSSSPASASAVSPSATVAVTVSSTTDQAVTLTKGQTLHVVLPSSAQQANKSTTYGVLPADTPVLAQVPGAADSFTAAAGGTAHITVTQRPACSPGDECPAHIINLGTVKVTVSG